ncbi:MAG: oligosaccharide flippase family protein [Erysipelotrichaceae bacterium]
MQQKKKVKQSFIAGALTGSAGIFITKALSLLYVIPFNEIAQDATVFYSYAYTVYDALLQVCLSGFPYAIATLVAKYATKDDYSSVEVVKKVSKSILVVLGVVCCFIMIAFSKVLAIQIIPTELQSTSYLHYTQIVLIILAFALVFVPYLSYYRGVYQGLKEMKIYAFTQVLEQIIRIAFLLAASSICVYVLDMDRIWAAYMGVLSTSVSAIGTIIYFLYHNKNIIAVEPVDTSSISKKEIFKELVKTAVPYLLSSLMFSSSGMFVLLVFADGLEAYGTDGTLITIYQGIINYQASKLSSIPTIIMTGFCLVIIPHITEAVTNRDDLKVQQLIDKILLTVNYLSVPLICFMIFFSKEIYYIMYGTYYLDIGASLLAKTLACQLLMNVAGVLNSLMIAIQMRKRYLLLESLRLVLMILIFKPCLARFGVNGYFIALASEYLLLIVGAISIVNSTYDINFKGLFDKITKSWIGCIPMFILAAFANNISFVVENNSRFIILIITGVMFVIDIGLFGVITNKLGVVEDVFGQKITFDSLKSLVNKVIKKN